MLPSVPIFPVSGILGLPETVSGVIVPLTGSFARAEHMGAVRRSRSFVSARGGSLGAWRLELRPCAGHTGIDRIRRNLIAERINRALGIAQIVIPMHFLVEILQTSK